MGCIVVFVFFKQKTAYELRISDWSSDVCSSDLIFSWSINAPACSPGAACLPRAPGSPPWRHLPARPAPAARIPFSCDRLSPFFTHQFAHVGQMSGDEIGSASCRESGCQYVYITGVAESLKQKTMIINTMQ